ncbi:MAG: hypothetical protein U0270_26430 [Labilithrix sp.]
MSGDAFEESEMHDGAPIVHRDKVVSRGMTGMFFGSGAIIMLASAMVGLTNATSTKPLPAAAVPIVVASLIAFGVAMWIAGIMFGVIRTLVTRKAVHVKYGLWGPTIPNEAIESARVVEYDWTEFGGWGMKIGKGGARAYVTRNGPCVEIIYRDDNGKSKRVLIGSENASATVAAINEARGHVRVADDVARSTAADEESAAEDAAVEETEKRSAG